MILTIILATHTICSVMIFGETVFQINHARRYRKHIFKCVPGDDCRFECNNIYQVGTSDWSSCNLDEDMSHGSCECSTIRCSDGGYNCQIGCEKQNSCYMNDIYCGDGSVCNIYCRDMHACSHANIYCGDGSICNIYCLGYHSCVSMDFYCGANSNCSVECNAYGQYGTSNVGDPNIGRSCYYSRIYASDSNFLKVDVYNNLEAAKEMILYTPNTDSFSPTVIKCGINTYDTSNYQYACDQMEIHSVDGWNDVELQTIMSANDVFVDYDSSDQTMYCGANGEFFCHGWNINGNLMECHGDITICNTYSLP
eukprot:145799_1